MTTTRANPSSRTSRTTPRPSTWPCTTWPPSRSAARSSSSRLTRDPGCASPNDERRSVSCMTSAPNSSPPHIPTAVRHTPLTATLSPSLSSRASGERTLSRTPSAVRSTRWTSPRSWTRPVNIRSPLPQARLDEQVLPDRLPVERQRPRRVGDLLDAAALHRVARSTPADEDRRQEQAHLVDLAGVEERARQVGAALEQDRRHAALAERHERGAHAGLLVLPRRHDDVRAGHLERIDRVARRGARDDDRERHLGRRRHELRVQRQTRGRVEDDAPRLAFHAVDAGRELRVVGQRGADPDGDGVDRGAPLVRAPPAGLAG